MSSWNTVDWDWGKTQDEKDHDLHAEYLRFLMKNKETKNQKDMAAKESRKIAEQARLEDAKGRTKTEETRLLEKQDSLNQDQWIQQEFVRYMNGGIVRASSTDSTTSTRTATTETTFDVHAILDIRSEDEYVRKFVLLVDNLGTKMGNAKKQGFLRRYFVHGITETAFFDALVKSEKPFVQLALKEASRVLGFNVKGIKKVVMAYLEDFRSKVNQAKSKIAKFKQVDWVKVNWMFVDTEDGNKVKLCPCWVVEAEFVTQDLAQDGRVTFRVKIQTCNKSSKRGLTPMSRICYPV